LRKAIQQGLERPDGSGTGTAFSGAMPGTTASIEMGIDPRREEFHMIYHRFMSAAAASIALFATACGGPKEGTQADDTAAMNNIVGTDETFDDNISAAAKTVAATPDYVTNAALGDMYEIQSSKMAQSKAKSADVKSFAGIMITDHAATTAALKAALSKAGVPVTPPASLDPRHQAMIQQLEAATPDGFDALYRQQQIAAHQEALQLHQGYAAGGDNPTLVAIASETAPKVQMHLDMLRKMAP
jgi:putative membrane protein